MTDAAYVQPRQLQGHPGTERSAAHGPAEVTGVPADAGELRAAADARRPAPAFGHLHQHVLRRFVAIGVLQTNVDLRKDPQVVQPPLRFEHGVRRKRLARNDLNLLLDERGTGVAQARNERAAHEQRHSLVDFVLQRHAVRVFARYCPPTELRIVIAGIEIPAQDQVTVRGDADLAVGLSGTRRQKVAIVLLGNRLRSLDHQPFHQCQRAFVDAEEHGHLVFAAAIVPLPTGRDLNVSKAVRAVEVLDRSAVSLHETLAEAPPSHIDRLVPHQHPF